MISCVDYIYTYSELFKYLEERGGYGKVVELWEGIREEFLANLRDYVARDGLKGMYAYWSHTLGEEGGRHHMSLYDDMFVIDMHDCPSAKKVFREGRIEPYPKYCEHCPVLYPPLLREFGYDVEYHIIDCESGQCRLVVRKPEGAATPDARQAPP